MQHAKSFTMRHFGVTYRLEAWDHQELASKLFTLTSWRGPDCERMAKSLMYGRVVSAPDFETIIVPGEVEVVHWRPLERRSWRPA